MRTPIFPTEASLSIIEGDLKEVHNEGEYVGTFPELEIRLELNGRDYYFNEFEKAGVGTLGFSAKSECEALIEKIWEHRSVDLKKWFCCSK